MKPGLEMNKNISKIRTPATAAAAPVVAEQWQKKKKRHVALALVVLDETFIKASAIWLEAYKVS